MYKDFLLLLQEDRMLDSKELKRRVCTLQDKTFSSSVIVCITCCWYLCFL